MRNLWRALTAAVVLAAAILPALAQASPPRPDPYTLRRDSTYESGCFAPCLCPILMRGPVQGRFRLTFAGSDGLFDHYAVEDVRWKVSSPTGDLLVTGSGIYRIGGQPERLHQLTLDLQVGGEPVQRFDSGLVAPVTAFPSIDARISMNGEVCRDTVFDIHARRVRAVQVGAASIVWEAQPPADGHDLIRGSLRALRASGGDFGVAVERCLADDLPGDRLVSADDPQPGEGFFYLLRDVEGGFAGSFDSGEESQAVPRDALIDASPSSCPG